MEDKCGGMDLKVAGTRSTVTSCQMDVKAPVPVEIVLEALKKNATGRGRHFVSPQIIGARTHGTGALTHTHMQNTHKNTKTQTHKHTNARAGAQGSSSLDPCLLLQSRPALFTNMA